MPRRFVRVEYGKPTDWESLSPRTKDERLTLNRYVLATQYTRVQKEASTPEQWEAMCLEERDDLIEKTICPKCRVAYANSHSLRTHYSLRQNECKRTVQARDDDRERTKKNKAAAKRLADPFADNDRRMKRQAYAARAERDEDGLWPYGNEHYEDYLYEKEHYGCGGNCKN